MNWMAASIALVTAFAVTPIVRLVGRRFGVLDVPGDRSSHSVPTPRAGGIAILAGAFVALAWTIRTVHPWDRALAWGMVVIAVIGIVDDLVRVRAGVKLAAQIVAAGIVVVAGGAVLRLTEVAGMGAREPWIVAAAVAVFWFVGVSNAFNFMDGINGIAACEAVVCGVAQAILASRAGQEDLAVIALALAAASLGFLPWNFPRASIFMGDVGSATLGFCFAAIAVLSAARGGSFVAAALPLFPFLFDTSVTLTARILRREAFMSPHRSHFYQQLVRSGWSHASVTMLWTALAVGSSAVALAWPGLQTVGRLLVAAVLVVVHAAVAKAISRRLRFRGTTA